MAGRVALFALLALALPSGARAQCDVEGVASLDRLRVRIDGSRLRTLQAIGLPMTFRVGRGLYQNVRVRSPLAFEARSDRTPEWRVRGAGPLEGDVLWVTERVPLRTVRAVGGGERVDVVAELAPGVEATEVELPCARLTFGRPGWSTGPERRAPALRPGNPVWWPAREWIWLLDEPGRGPSVRLRFAGIPPALSELDRRGAWVKVGLSLEATGSRATGWVRQRVLRVVDRERLAQRATSVGPRRGPPVTRDCRRRRRDGEYVGPAMVDGGSLVRTRPNGEPWATVAETTTLTVLWRIGQAWARILHVPGLRGDGRCPEVLRRAWVERGAVHLQGERARRANNR